MIDECKVTSTFKPAQPNNESRLREEIDRLRQRQLLRDDEIKDLRNKNLKLELEIKEKAQRERNVSRIYLGGIIRLFSGPGQGLIEVEMVAFAVAREYTFEGQRSY